MINVCLSAYNLGMEKEMKCVVCGNKATELALDVWSVNLEICDKQECYDEIAEDAGDWIYTRPLA